MQVRISEQHQTEMTTYRTVALANDHPAATFIAVLHAMVIRMAQT